MGRLVLLLTADSISTDSISSFARVVSYLIAVLFVLFLAYVSTRLLGKARIGKIKGNQIHLIDKFFVSSDKALLLVKLGENYYFMSSDKSGLKILDKVDEEDLPNLRYETEKKVSASKLKEGSFLDKLNNKRKGNL